ncbi:hypothetical protein ACOMHN_005364 [Nucella lapillus]
MQTRTWSHPEGPEHLVIQEQNRGRWRCQDVVDGPGGATSTPTIPDGERPATVLPASRVDDGAQSPPPACDPHLTHGSGVDGSQPDMAHSSLAQKSALGPVRRNNMPNPDVGGSDVQPPMARQVVRDPQGVSLGSTNGQGWWSHWG